MVINFLISLYSFSDVASFPALIGSFEKINNFCTFISIAQIRFSQKLCEDDLAILQDLIMNDPSPATYPSCTTPWLIDYLLIHLHLKGLAHLCCMRYEAKHKHF